jgi:hypothetical protein
MVPAEIQGASKKQCMAQLSCQGNNNQWMLHEEVQDDRDCINRMVDILDLTVDET